MSPGWKLTTVLQVVAGPRASTKNVSLPVALPMRKLEPPAPSSTLAPLAACSESSPAPLLRNMLGAAATIDAESGLDQMYWRSRPATGPEYRSALAVPLVWAVASM